MARGYETITDSRRLAELKIVKAARDCVPGLLIPLLDVRGLTWGYQYRPDSPRIRENKPVKYETPYQQRNGLDIPPVDTVRDALGDPNVPLWVTEGTKKADCGVHYQLCIVALSGVWNWRGTNDMGGKTAIADWNDIALTGRRVILAFDGDVVRKRSAAKALCALAEYLKYRGAKVTTCIYLTPIRRPAWTTTWWQTTPSKTCGHWSNRSSPRRPTMPARIGRPGSSRNPNRRNPSP